MTNKYFAVIDVETNWDNRAMSVGVAVGNDADFSLADKKYYVLSPEYQRGGFYSRALSDIDGKLITVCTRESAVKDMVRLFAEYAVADVFAYNAPFDYKCMPELHSYVWHDILPVAANRNTNGKLPDNCEYFGTGLLKRGRGLENIMRLIYWQGYTERHNALLDALDELQLMRLLDQPLSVYRKYEPEQYPAPRTIMRSPLFEQRRQNTLRDYRYVVDELCGGAVRLLDFSQTARTYKKENGEVERTCYSYYFYLQCSRCAYKWTQDAEIFFQSPKCPKCGK